MCPEIFVCAQQSADRAGLIIRKINCGGCRIEFFRCKFVGPLISSPVMPKPVCRPARGFPDEIKLLLLFDDSSLFSEGAGRICFPAAEFFRMAMFITPFFRLP